jgi:hypothetical protein
MRRRYVVPMRSMVIYEYDVPAGTLNLKSTKLPRPWSRGGSSPSRKNPHGRTGNRTQDLMISSQKLWPLDYEAGWDRVIQTIRVKYSCNLTEFTPSPEHYYKLAASEHNKTLSQHPLCLNIFFSFSYITVFIVQCFLTKLCKYILFP